MHNAHTGYIELCLMIQNRNYDGTIVGSTAPGMETKVNRKLFMNRMCVHLHTQETESTRLQIAISFLELFSTDTGLIPMEGVWRQRTAIQIIRMQSTAKAPNYSQFKKMWHFSHDIFSVTPFSYGIQSFNRRKLNTFLRLKMVWKGTRPIV